MDSSDQLEEISTHRALIPIRYSGDTILNVDRILRIVPFKRNVFTMMHRTHKADFMEHKWIIRYGNPEVWYERPGRAMIKHMSFLETSGCVTDASPALTTPMDDDIYNCTAGHSLDGDYTGACHQCTDEKSEAEQDLVYYIVLSTWQASDVFVHRAHFNGRQIYKLVKCGSREGAAAEAFYAAGVNGWNVAFSCVVRMGETFGDRTGAAERVEGLWNLGEDGKDNTTVRVFF
ncbi:hypothetical protein K469DRAFT_729439 [Zopfia rhizophila CBS 207.26]|uniref:Uncharacterized protein n=1 Tax=Zopfia rhizophila CBS 207.26 TaxID=1314779 RepID=A0A6A6DU97_9PEZI|nr:hypothetical protein K469DRAFT_729439 [Zopfia rhizophila CBS 207.26]